MDVMTVAHEHAGVRLDKYLSVHHRRTARSVYHTAIKSGLILVNEKQSKPAYKVKPSDVINVKKEAYTFDPLKGVKDSLSIIHEDNRVLVVNKPAGLTVHPTEHSRDSTLVNMLLSHHPRLKDVGDSPFRPGVVHRLDKEASGIMIIAKTNKMFQYLKQGWQQGLVKKKYTVLVWGSIKEKGEISLGIERSKRTGKMVARKNGGKSALTLYIPIKHFTNATLLEVETRTGRTHQIRAHFKAIGHPVVGDVLYHHKKKSITPNRLFLHASELTIPFEDGAVKTWVCSPPKELTLLLEKLKPEKK